MGFKVPFLVLLSFIFSVQVYFLLKAVFNLWEDLRRLYYAQTSRFSAISIVAFIKHSPITIDFKISFPAYGKLLWKFLFYLITDIYPWQLFSFLRATYWGSTCAFR